MSKQAIVVVLLAAIFISGQAYCQQGPGVITVSGKIDQADAEGGIINVKTDHGTMVFHLSTESRLFKAAHHMSLIEIEPGDDVVIRYISSSGQNNVISLVDNKSE